MLTAQQKVAGVIALALARIPEDKLLEDPGLATRPAHQLKSKLNKLYAEFQEANNNLKEAMTASAQGEAFQEHQDKALAHSSQVNDHIIMLDQIIRIQQEQKHVRRRKRTRLQKTVQRTWLPRSNWISHRL